MRETVTEKVINHFEEVETYKNRKGRVHEEDSLILDFIQKKSNFNDKVLEIGGGSGALLDLILENNPQIKTYNVEIAYNAYKNQANKEITLIEGNALNLPFEDNTFEFVIAKNLLHHIVGNTHRKSKSYAKKAIKEMNRVMKNDGYIFILEQYNEYRLFSFLVFYMTLISSMLGISFSAANWNKDVIVSFLTPNELRMIFDELDLEIVFYNKNRQKVPNLWKYTLLMSNMGLLFLIGKKYIN